MTVLTSRFWAKVREDHGCWMWTKHFRDWLDALFRTA